MIGSISVLCRALGAVIVGVATLGLVACSGGVSVPSSSASVSKSDGFSMGGLVGPDACPQAKIYVADYGKNDVEIYPQGVTNPAPCAKITSGVSSPEAVYVDAKGEVYVSNYLTSNITEYLRGQKTPIITITTRAAGYDLFVGRDRTLYVAEPTANTVDEFAAGAIVPTLTLSINGGPHGVATDNRNNLYVSYLSNADGLSHVEKFAPKATTGTDLGFTVSFAGEVKLDKRNDIVIGDRNNEIVYVYPPGQTVPSRSFPTPGGRPVNFGLNKAESVLYVSGLSEVQVMNYHTGVQVGSITSGLQLPSGVAAYPPPPY